MLDVEALAGMLAPVISDEVAKATAPLLARIAELEARKPEPGPPGEKGERGEAGERGADGQNGADGKDGAGIVDGFVSRDGHLIATLSDGSTKDFGEIMGKDGKDGEPGKDGQNGFCLDDFDCVPVDERTLELQFTQGDRKEIYELVFPVIIDRGVYKEGEEYVRGDAVTWGGSLWIAQKDQPSKPDTPDSGWRLAVKKGRDGKDGKNG